MKKFSRFYKMFIITVLLSITITLCPLTAYYDASCAVVEASSAVPLGLDALMYMMQSVMASKGKSCGNVGDLSGLTTAFKEYMELLKNGDVGEASTYALVMPMIGAIEKLKLGDKIKLADFQPMLKEIDSFVTDFLPKMGKHFGDKPGVVSGQYPDWASVSKTFAHGLPLSNPEAIGSEFLPTVNQFGFLVFRSKTYENFYQYRFLAPYDFQNNIIVKSDNDYYSYSKNGGTSGRFLAYYFNQKYVDSSDMSVYTMRFEAVINCLDGWELVANKLKVPIYSSYESYIKTAELIASHPMYGYYYGDASKGFTLPENMCISDLSQTANVEKVVADNAGLDADALNLLISDNLAKIFAQQQDIDLSIGDNTAQVEISNSWLSKIYTQITSLFPSISAPLDAILSQSIAVAGTATDILDRLKPIDILLSGFQELSAFLLNILTSIKTAVLSIPSAIARIGDVVIGIPHEISNVRDVIITLPVAIADEIEKAFTLDPVIIGEATDTLVNAWELKLPFIPVISDMFHGISFSDKYDYPVFKMQCPTVIKRFVKSDTIVLFDGQDYADYFVMFRNILRAIIWGWFAYAVLNHFRVKFHIG